MTENRIYKALMLLAVIAVLAMMYHHHIILPEKQLEAEREQAALDRKAEREAEERREQKLTECDMEALYWYSENWDAQCRTRGLQDDCALPMMTANSLDDDLSAARDRCVQLYR